LTQSTDTRPTQAEARMFHPGLMRGARILVTGGGTGLGRIMATALAELGARVYICGRRAQVLADTAAAINDRIGASRVAAMACDMRDPQQIEALLEQVWADGGALTGLVNNAAANFLSRAEDVSAKGYNIVAETVMRGSFLMTTGCARRWIAEGRPASVVSILSTWVWNGGPFAAPATMAKAGVQAMTQSLAVEWGRHGIRLNGVCPGTFPTEGMSTHVLQGGLASPGNPMGRDGRPQELADLVTFLLAPGSAFISGQTIAIDGAGYQAHGANFSQLTAWGDEQWQALRRPARSAG
jgi:NAD(P)-dependent dehydrogenase (short-subunit alcohol dehydrogenase family)